MATTILVVDGHEMVRTALRQWLEEEFPSASVVEAVSGNEAIERIRFQVPSLVIIDVLVPGSIGINATRKVRDELPQVPIMILTMYEDEEYRVDMMNAGANVFLPKRQMHTQFIPRLRTMLDAVNA
jgi:DNA-binding NarL/FixJ family response regulator